MTLRDLSSSTGLSASYISSVERGAAAPSIASLQKIGAVFDTNVLGLMSESYEAPCSPLVRVNDRRVLDSDKGVRIEDLSTAGSNLEPLLFTFQPGCGSDGAISHEGEEFFYVMSGQLYLCLDGSDEYYLNPGDSMSYRSERAHEFGNPGDEPPPCSGSIRHGPSEPDSRLHALNSMTWASCTPRYRVGVQVSTITCP